MTNNTSSILAGMDDERSLSAAFTGAYQTIGSALTVNPVMIIFDNQSTVPVGVSKNGTSTWKTFAPGSALVLDMRSNHGKAFDFSFPIGTQFYGIGTAGTGSFKISIIYAE